MRMERLEKSMEHSDLDAFIMTRESNIYYYAGTVSGGILVLASKARPTLLIHEMNQAIAEAQASGCEIETYKGNNLFEIMADVLKTHRNVGYDDLTLDFSSKIQKDFPNIKLTPSAELIWNMRQVKDATEQKILKKAGELAVLGMEAVKESLRDGVREYEVAAEAAYAMMRNGAEDNAFPAIVASGPRSAYPHAGVTDRRVRKGDFVTVDIGATYERYRSDITRTFTLGEPSDKQVEIYESVLRAHQAALPFMREGADAKEVDKAARTVIDEAGYGSYFIHSLGHGVGLEVHEPPNLGMNSRDVLKVGNVVTDEPGVYIAGFGGVRTEDTVLITRRGPVSLTSFEKGFDDVKI